MRPALSFLGDAMSLVGQQVTVLGAGVAGLAVARALALRGASVTVLEQAEAIREVGAGLQISPNGMAVLRALGLAPALEAASVRARAVVLRDGFDGSAVLRMDLDRLRPGQGWHFVHRADLIDLLAQGAREAGVEIRLLTKVDRIDLSGARPVAVTAQGSIYDAPLMIGADGLHSPMRQALLGRVAPFFTHQVAWRATIPGDPSDPAEVEVHMGPGRHLVSYPLRGGTLRNIVAVEERRRWVEEGWSLRDDPVELRLAFESFSPRVRGWLERAEEVWLWGLFRHEVSPEWHRVLSDGAVALMGDAAHPTLPFLAQGANMALEDAWVLTQSLATTDSVAAGLAAYASARRPRCARIVEAANSNARAYHLSGAVRGLAHSVLRLGGRIAPGAGLKRFDWLYGHDVTA
jgi:salicylate hydroxylase